MKMKMEVREPGALYLNGSVDKLALPTECGKHLTHYFPRKCLVTLESHPTFPTVRDSSSTDYIACRAQYKVKTCVTAQKLLRISRW